MSAAALAMRTPSCVYMCCTLIHALDSARSALPHRPMPPSAKMAAATAATHRSRLLLHIHTFVAAHGDFS